jgi:hypothetical protein
MNCGQRGTGVVGEAKLNTVRQYFGGFSRFIIRVNMAFLLESSTYRTVK